MFRIRILLALTFVVLMVFMLTPVFVARAQDGTPEGTMAPRGDQGTGTPGTMMETPAAMAAPPVSLRNQALQDNRVVIGSVRSEGPGWLVIHSATADGSVGPDIGHAPLTAGENPHVVVAFEAPSAVTASLFAMIHVDAGTIGLYEFPGPDVPAVADNKVLNFGFSITGGLDGAGTMMETPAVMMEEATPEAMATP